MTDAALSACPAAADVALWQAVLAAARLGAAADAVLCDGLSVVDCDGSFDVRPGRVRGAIAHCDRAGAVTVAPTQPPTASSLLHLYLPLCLPRAVIVVAHLGQSLDGRIATVGGASHYVTGMADILHNHRMRALFDAIVVGAATVAHDDPRLTVRRCAGDHPVRVVIDSERRLGVERQLFRDSAAETLLLCAADRAQPDERHGGAAVVGLARGEEDADGVDPVAVIEYLRQRGLRRIFIEGGGVTVSRFLAAGCVDRLQVTVAPLILGSGRPSISLPEIESLKDGMRPKTRRFAFGEDVMFECVFRG